MEKLSNIYMAENQTLELVTNKTKVAVCNF